MYDVIGIGANSVDHVYRLPELPGADTPFAKVPISEASVSFGGQATTTLAACAAMGLRTRYVGTTGSDEHGRRMRDELARVGIDIGRTIVREADNPFAVILVDSRSGERTVLWHRDAGIALQPSDIDPDTIRSGRSLYVDDVDVDASAEAARVARECRLPVISDVERTDVAGRQLIDAVTIPILAEHVPTALTGEPDMARALAALRRSHHTMVCVTLGARGAMLLEGDRVHHQAGLPIQAVDTTGAGDVFRGAFIYALLRGDAPRDILRFANAAAGLSCTRVGAMASAPTLAETEAALSPTPS